MALKRKAEGATELYHRATAGTGKDYDICEYKLTQAGHFILK